MIHRYVIAELLKLRRSLALLLCIAAPACVAILSTMIALDRDKPGAKLEMFAPSGAALWAFAMLPLALTALSVLMAQMEHGSRSWNHMLTLPGARPRLYLAKALVMLGLVALMSALLFVMIVAAGNLVGWLRPQIWEGSLGAASFGKLVVLMTASSTLVAMLQLWVALRYRSFVPPLVFGIAGTFAAIAATSAKQGVYFPWLMAVNMLSSDPARRELPFWLGSVGGLAVMAAMLWHLNRREV